MQAYFLRLYDKDLIKWPVLFNNFDFHKDAYEWVLVKHFYRYPVGKVAEKAVCRSDLSV